MRFLGIAIVVIIAIMAGLFFYGHTLSPDTREITQDAINVQE